MSRCDCQRKKAIAEKLMAIPGRFRDCTLENYKPGDAQQRKAHIFLGAKFTESVFLFGSFGRGKTHLLTAQYKRLVQIERPAMFFGMAELLRELRRAEMDSDYFCEVRHRTQYAETFHLFIDDIDKFKATEFKFEVLFDLIDNIYTRNLGLSLTSNRSAEALMLSETLHPAIVRRIADICQMIQV